MERRLQCNSCNIELTGGGNASFKCPSCLKQEIRRCGHCREVAAKYTCASCNFTGPN